MKAKRQAYLLQIVRERDIETQEEIMVFMHKAGYQVTQATVSRDIKELRLAKIPNGQGGYKYSIPQGTTKGDLNRRARRVFEDYVKDIDFSQNLLIIKTYPGGANAVAAALDDLDWDGVVASLAGDDVIILVIRERSEEHLNRPSGIAGQLYQRLEELMQR